MSLVFREKVRATAGVLGVEADWLMACMAFETGETFRADIRNAAGSGAVGLIQFMPSTAHRLGTTPEALALLTPEAQLNYVELYFLPLRGKLHSLEDCYMAILWPRAVGKPEDYVLFVADAGARAYYQNRGLDLNADGKITKAEACAKVRKKLETRRLVASQRVVRGGR